MKLNLRMPKRLWLPVLLVTATVLVITGAVFALTTFSYHGTMTITTPGGGGGGGGWGPVPTFDFTVTDNASNPASVIDTATAWDGHMDPGGSITKTVYLTKTGTAPAVNVVVSASNVGTGLTISAGTASDISTTGLVVPLSSSTPVEVVLTFTAAQTATGTPGFNVSFTKQ